MNRIILNCELTKEATQELTNWIAEKAIKKEILSTYYQINEGKILSASRIQKRYLSYKDKIGQLHTGYNDLLKDE